MKPLLKWPGGKRRVLKYIMEHVPTDYNAYYEPFFGGGAVYFDLCPEKATISDINSELINVYQQIKDNPEELIDYLEQEDYWENTLDNFLEIRAQDRDDSYEDRSLLHKAARLIYLNKTSFNGLYRVNAKGQFNAHYGKYENPSIKNPELIREIHAQFQRGTEIRSDSFRNILRGIDTKENFIYLDPPYIPASTTASFTSYSKEGFRDPDQIELRDMMKELDEKGNYVLQSNSDTPRTRELYKGFTIVPISVMRSISVTKEGRKTAGEVLILSDNLASVLDITQKEAEEKELIVEI